jgi:adenine-specific DNA-methyltransferase
MPSLDWIGKKKVINHHLDVPYRILQPTEHFNTETESQNKIIKGDNLAALKSLLPEYEGKIKCIYIDPPYNTGNEQWVYNDNVNSPKIQKWLNTVVGKDGEDLTRHDKWLCMMYPRLKLLHRLLADDGAIFISIDDNEQAHLKLICDEIFGGSNYITCVHWKRSESQNNNAKHLSIVGEYIICYLKNKSNVIFNKVDLKETALKEYRYKDDKGNFRRGTIVDNSRGKHLLTVTSPSGITKTIKSIRTEDFFNEHDKNGLIYWTKTGTPYLKLYLNKSEGQIASNWFDKTGVNEDASEDLTKMKIDFQFSKPYQLVRKILQITTDKDSIILDSFAGSGTTAHAVLNLNKEDGGNRKFILVEMEDYADTITAERVRRVIKGYGKGTKAVEGTGGDFTFYELGETMFIDKDFLNENLPLEEIRKYVYYTETGSTKTYQAQSAAVHIDYLGHHHNTDYYFHYKKGELTTLDTAFLNTITQKADGYVIYADVCGLSDDMMRTHNIVFKKIPRDITRL